MSDSEGVAVPIDLATTMDRLDRKERELVERIQDVDRVASDFLAGRPVEDEDLRLLMTLVESAMGKLWLISFLLETGGGGGID